MRRYVLLALAGLVLLFFAAVWLGSRWLESSGGRALLEKELARRVNLPVHLLGEFDLMLWPAVGVAGGGLVVGGPVQAEAPFSSRGYEVALALRPLLEGEYRVEWIRLDGGVLAPARFATSTGSDQPAATGGFRLPEVRELVLRDFAILLGNEASEPFRIGSLRIRDFAENRETHFDLDLGAAGPLTGVFLWDGAGQLLQLTDVRWESPGGALQGSGCVAFAPKLAVNFELSAETLDLDALQAGLDFDLGEASDGPGESPDMNIRLAAGELRGADAVARGVSLVLGKAPTCQD